MIFTEDDEESSFIAQLKKSYAGDFKGANINIQTAVFGNNVCEKADRKPEDIIPPTQGKMTTPASEKKEPKSFTKEKLGRAIKAVQEDLWAKSSYGIIFSAARDACNSDYTMRQFEDDVQALSEELKLDYNCPRGTLATTFCRNRYLKTHIDKWPAKGVKRRSIKLAGRFIENINNQD